MWPRVVELMLACWLAISPFVFRYAGDSDNSYAGDTRLLWANDFTCAALIATAALLSLHHKFRRMHLMHLVIALWLIAFAFARPSPPPAPYQNYVVIGLLLTLLAVIPTRASEPPSAWREFYDQPTK